MTARRLTAGLIHLLVLRSAWWSDVAAAQPPGAVAGALGLVASVSCQAAEVPACVSRDVALRTVRLEMRDGWCSGVLTGPRTIRTAAHCFRFGGPLFRVTRADGSALPARFKWVSTFGPPTNPSAIDQAEIRADRDLIGPGRLAVAEPSVEPDRRAVVVAGYPGGGRLRVHAARVSDHYRGGDLRAGRSLRALGPALGVGRRRVGRTHLRDAGVRAASAGHLGRYARIAQPDPGPVAPRQAAKALIIILTRRHPPENTVIPAG